LLTEKILLLAVKDWARKLGVASYDKVAIRGDQSEPPRVGTFAWDLAGPSYLRPLMRRENDGKPKPGFVVCDALVGEQVQEGAVAAFVRKCRAMSALRRVSPLLPILMADRFSREALRTGRSNGIMMASPASLFGREVAEGLGALLETLTKAAAVAVKRPEVIGELFDKLGAIEGAALNLRGALFELLVGHCVVKNDDGSIDIGKDVVDTRTGERAEIDIFRVKEHREVWVYECKGHQPSEIVGLEAVEKWVTERVARIYRILCEEPRFSGSEFHFEYWACGSFDAEATAFLTQAAERTKKYAIGWKDGPAVRAYAAKVKPKAILKMFDQHFFNHPIARFAKKYDANAEMSQIAESIRVDGLLGDDGDFDEDVGLAFDPARVAG
jgi:hypothetical protein